MKKLLRYQIFVKNVLTEIEQKLINTDIRTQVLLITL